MSKSRKSIIKSLGAKKKRRTIKNSISTAKFKEITMPSEIMEQIFDETAKMGYETEEETEYSDNKKIYNSEIYISIKRAMSEKRYGKQLFTDRQREIFELMYIKGLTQKETADYLGLNTSTIRTTRINIFKKIKNKISYDFTYTEKDQD